MFIFGDPRSSVGHIQPRADALRKDVRFQSKRTLGVNPPAPIVERLHSWSDRSPSKKESSHWTYFLGNIGDQWAVGLLRF
jgi:hypothetical protein